MTKPIDRRDHPCLSCPLPDCNDESPKCPLRRILSKESCMRRRGEFVPEDLRHQRSIAYYEIYHWAKVERMRLRREGVRS